jgi:hypothetical protein
MQTAKVGRQRIATRLTNPLGKTAEERRRILADLEAVEPLLWTTSTVEIVTTIPVTEVADTLDETVARQAGAEIRRAFPPVPDGASCHLALLAWTVRRLELMRSPSK